MKSKKLYIGTIALALSIGTLAPLGNNAISSVAYASEQNNQKQNEEKNIFIFIFQLNLTKIQTQRMK